MSQGDLLTSSQAAKRIGVSKQQLHRYRHAGVLLPVSTTLGGHCRWLESDIELFLLSRGCGTSKNGPTYGEDRFVPLDIRSFVNKNLYREVIKSFPKLSQWQDQKNAISVKCDLETETIDVNLSVRNQRYCPAQLVHSSGESSFVLQVAFKFPPTGAHALSILLDYYYESISNIQHVLSESNGTIYSSSYLRVSPLAHHGWYWLWIREYPFILRLPKKPSIQEWDLYNQACTRAYIQLSRHQFMAPAFQFLT